MNTARIVRFYSSPVSGILFALWAYLGTLLAAALAPRYLAAGGTRDIVVLVPTLTLVLVVSIIGWVYRASDEYVRRRILGCAALTGVILAFSSLGWFCLELLGYPRLSMISINLFGWSVFTVLMLSVLYRAK
ncbi:MAG TPA: hypothetical protein VMC02_07910 [Steroidobacteraceae bacterium]|nr:hypothetical protein [Steroidobacteraceae bacterium]